MTPLILTFAIVLAAVTFLWGASLALKDSSIADIFWAPGFALVVWSFSLTSASSGPSTPLILTPVSAWALRLGLHVFMRHSGEDHRYAAMRKTFGRRWWWRSLFQVFWLQGALIWIISLPLQIALGAHHTNGIVDVAATLLAFMGFFIEALADYQLSRFRSNSANKGLVMNKGLWSWSRHPNYFGDALMWWGFCLFGISAGSGYWWVIVSPLIMTFLLLRVSGVNLMERDIAERRPGYTDYVRRTSAFVPWPPRLM